MSKLSMLVKDFHILRGYYNAPPKNLSILVVLEEIVDTNAKIRNHLVDNPLV